MSPHLQLGSQVPYHEGRRAPACPLHCYLSAPVEVLLVAGPHQHPLGGPCLGSFKLMRYSRRLLVVEQGARVDKVYLVEWDLWALPEELVMLLLFRSVCAVTVGSRGERGHSRA